jgi:hypothetical protein
VQIANGHFVQAIVQGNNAAAASADPRVRTIQTSSEDSKRIADLENKIHEKTIREEALLKAMSIMGKDTDAILEHLSTPTVDEVELKKLRDDSARLNEMLPMLQKMQAILSGLGLNPKINGWVVPPVIPKVELKDEDNTPVAAVEEVAATTTTTTTTTQKVAKPTVTTKIAVGNGGWTNVSRKIRIKKAKKPEAETKPEVETKA